MKVNLFSEQKRTQEESIAKVDRANEQFMGMMSTISGMESS